MFIDMDQGIKEKVERMKAKAELFLENDIRVFIKTIYDDYYFCDIILVGDVYLVVQSFTGKRNGEKDKLVWTDIVSLDEYKERGIGE